MGFLPVAGVGRIAGVSALILWTLAAVNWKNLETAESRNRSNLSNKHLFAFGSWRAVICQQT
jgi:hypothetical protein